MFAVVNPEVLSNEWSPPVPVGRELEVREVVRRLDPPMPTAPPPWVVAVAGAPGTGTSTVARRAGRELVELLRRIDGAAPPRLLVVRTSAARGAHGVATALLRRLDDGFDGRGFPVAEILAGLLRRLRREGRPFVIILDDVSVGGPELAPVLRALAQPDRFLPEGEHGLPSNWTILAGTPEGLFAALRGSSLTDAIHPFIPLRPYAPDQLRTLVQDRAHRALGRPAPESVVDRAVRAAIEDGGGSRRAVEVLRRELLGRARPAPSGFVPRDGETAIRIEPWVVDAIGRASAGTSARVSEVRRIEAELARAEGAEPLPTTTLWRRIVRLERAGYVRREIRTGGSGGTRSLVRLLTPVEEWVTAPVVPQTRRDASPYAGPAAPEPGAPARLAPPWPVRAG